MFTSYLGSKRRERDPALVTLTSSSLPHGLLSILRVRPGLAASSAVSMDVTLAISLLHLGQYWATSQRGLHRAGDTQGSCHILPQPSWPDSQRLGPSGIVTCLAQTGS